MFENFDLESFWSHNEYASEKYVEPCPTDADVAEIELQLGFSLPAAYLMLMRVQNGGFTESTCFPTDAATSWAEDHVAITGFLSIGRSKTYSLLGQSGSRFMQEEWGYPTFGICICNCPSAGHDMIMLDYRECGPHGEPSVVHVDQEDDYRVTPLAPDFETFVRGLVPPSYFEPSEEELQAELERKLSILETGALSSAIREALQESEDPGWVEGAFRGLLQEILLEKGYFALHGDKRSHLVYDLLFDLASQAGEIESPESFLPIYESLLAFGDGEVTTQGYAPKFITDWLSDRLDAGQMVERSGRYRLSASFRSELVRKLRERD